MGIQNAKKGKDVGDHPPITPTNKPANNLKPNE
jgi:hypothetical protein